MLKPERKFIFIFFLLAVILFIYPVIGTDFGWHLRVGEYIVQTQSIPYTDFLSFSMEGYQYVYHSWLTEVGIYLSHVLAGPMGVSIFYALLLSIGLYFTVQSVSPKTKATYLAALCLTPVVVALVGIRTQIITYVLLSVLFFILTRAKQLTNTASLSDWIKRNNLWVIPPLFVFWSNVHGGFSQGLVLLGLFFASTIISEYVSKRAIRPIIRLCLFSALLFLISILATSINPYGFRQLMQAIMMQTNTTALATNMDWRSLFQYEQQLGFFVSFDIVVLLLVGFGIGGSKGKPTFLRNTVMLITLLLACFVTMRFSLIILIVAFPTVIALIAKLLRFARKSLFPGMYGLVLITLLLLGMVLMHSSQAICTAMSHECVAALSRLSDTSSHYPLSAVWYMQEHGVPNRLLNNFNHGGYLHYYFKDQFFVDGRMDNFFKEGESFIVEYLKLVYTQEGWEEIFYGYNFDGVLGKKDWPLTNALIEKGWVIVNEDDVNVLLLPSG